MRSIVVLGVVAVCTACGSASDVGGDPAESGASQEAVYEIDETGSAEGDTAQYLVGNDEESRFGELGAVVLWGLKPLRDGLALRLYSGGCTGKENIKIVVYESYPPQLLFVRTRVDRCGQAARYPDGVELVYKFSELRIGPHHGYKVLNRLESRPSPL